MDYRILRHWAQTCKEMEFSVESCVLEPAALILKGKGKQELVFNTDQGDPYPFFRQKGKAGEDSSLIWNQLNHARLEDCRIADSDRIIYLQLRAEDIYQQVSLYTLVLECAPRHPNAILCKTEASGLLIRDALVKYGYADNPQRQILPNLLYQSPQSSYQPDLTKLSGSLELKIPGTAETILCADVNDYLAKHYTLVLLRRKELQDLALQKSWWKKEAQKLQRKFKLQAEDLASAEKAGLYISYAEAIKYKLREIKTGQAGLIAIDYLDPELKEIKVPLLQDKSPLENMNFYIKRYQKAKKGLAVIQENMAKTRADLDRLDSILQRIEQGESVPIMSNKGSSPGPLTHKLSLLEKLQTLRIDQDFELVIGRKASENDFITTQLGRPHDWWFHTRIYHGSHVLLRCLTKKDPSPELIRLCCSLAAWNSKAKFSSNVPVDYTQIRYVRKPRKSAPGYVIYSNHHTVYAEPIDLRAVKQVLGL